MLILATFMMAVTAFCTGVDAFDLFDLPNFLDVFDLIAESSPLLTVLGVFGVPQLFEIVPRQPRTLTIAEGEAGLPVIRLRRGAVITRQIVDELNALLAETYWRGHDTVTSEDASSALPAPRPNAS